MSINLNALFHATRSLERPTEIGQIKQISVDRISMLNREFWPKKDFNKDETLEVAKLVAVKYCKNQHECWLEWELVQ